MLKDFKRGLSLFWQAFAYILKQPDFRRWYRAQLGKALLWGSIFLVLFASVLAIGFWLVFDLVLWAEWGVWLSSISGVFLGLLWIVILYFTAGPLSLLFFCLQTS